MDEGRLDSSIAIEMQGRESVNLQDQAQGKEAANKKVLKGDCKPEEMSLPG